MIDNYVNTLETVQLFIYKDGERVSADATPTATAEDADSGEAVQLSPVTVVNEIGYNYYEVTLHPSEVKYARTVIITWTYEYNLDQFNRIDVVNVVRPYFEPDDLWQSFPSYTSEGGDPQSVDDIKRLERLVRMRIDNFCRQSFQDLGRKVIRHRGTGTNSLQLKHNIYRLEAVTANGVVFFNRDENGDPDTQVLEWSADDPSMLTKTYTGSTAYTQQEDVVEGGMHATGSLFKTGKSYDVDAFYGWKYLPAAVRQAALLLADDALHAGDKYRQSNLSVVRSADFRFEFGQDHHGTTGNVDADIILGDYMWEGVFVF